MRYIEIDGERYDVLSCMECPCYDGGDMGWGENCKHPKGNGRVCDKHNDYGPRCPLREEAVSLDKVCMIDWPEGEGEE